jgi:hypothetical protein
MRSESGHQWHYVLNSGLQYSTISDNGPNQGYTYWPSNQIFSTWNFQYEINPDLENTVSAFYQAQCGNYSATTNPNGFISGSSCSLRPTAMNGIAPLRATTRFIPLPSTQVQTTRGTFLNNKLLLQALISTTLARILTPASLTA